MLRRNQSFFVIRLTVQGKPAIINPQLHKAISLAARIGQRNSAEMDIPSTACWWAGQRVILGGNLWTGSAERGLLEESSSCKLKKETFGDQPFVRVPFFLNRTPSRNFMRTKGSNTSHDKPPLVAIFEDVGDDGDHTSPLVPSGGSISSIEGLLNSEKIYFFVKMGL